MALGAEAGQRRRPPEARIDAQQPDDVCTLHLHLGHHGRSQGRDDQPRQHHVDRGPDRPRGTIGTALRRPDHAVVPAPVPHRRAGRVSLHGPMVSWRHHLSFAESIDLLGDNLREVHPTIFLGRPSGLGEDAGEDPGGRGRPEQSGLKKKPSGAWARKQGLKGGYADQEGQRARSAVLRPGQQGHLVFDKVRDRLGLDQLPPLQITSAAPISKSTLEFFLSLGLPIMEVYGMSECTGPATTCCLPGAYKTSRATVGRVLPGRRGQDRRGRRDLHEGPPRLQGLPQERGRHRRGPRRRGLAALSGDIGEIDADGFLQDHRPQEGPHHHRRRREHRAAGHRGQAQGRSAWVSQAVVVGDRQQAPLGAC